MRNHRLWACTCVDKPREFVHYFAISKYVRCATRVSLSPSKCATRCRSTVEQPPKASTDPPTNRIRISDGGGVLACSYVKRRPIDRMQLHRMTGVVGAPFRLVVLLLSLVLAGGQSELDGTLLFLHVWKCGGTSLRRLMCDWADREGLPCATVAGCRSLSLKVLHCYKRHFLDMD